MQCKGEKPWRVREVLLPHLVLWSRASMWLWISCLELGCCLAIFVSLYTHTHTHKYILLPLLLIIIIITGLCQETKAKPDVH